MAKVEDPLFWFDFRDHLGQRWEMYLATEEGCTDLRTLMGVTYPASRICLVNVAEPKSTQDYVALHEKAHAACDDLKFVSHGMEERVINQMDRPFWCMLRSVGFDWPARPDGYAALKRKACRLRKKERC